MNPVFLSDSVYLHVGTCSPTTGAATNADSTPTVTVEEDGVALGYAPTVTNVATGLYRVQIDATAANGFEAGRRYSAYVTATVATVTGRDGLAEFEVLAIDLNTALDAAITSRASASALATVQADTDDIQAKLGIPANLGSGATVADNLSDIEGQTDDIGVAGAGLTALGDARLANLDAAISTRAVAGNAMTLTSGERDAVAAALLDLAAGVETGSTVRQALRLILAAVAGKLSGAATTTVTIRDTNDGVDRIVATVDADGNRTAVTLNAA